MSNIPADLRYTKDHEYVKPTADAAIVAIGITDYAQGELGDIVYVELPKVGATYKEHEVFGTVEAVKPVTGEVVEVNGRIDGEPALINTEPYEGGWMIKVRVAPGGDVGLMTAQEYKGQLGE